MPTHEQTTTSMPNKTPLLAAGAVAVLLGVGVWVLDLSSSLQLTAKLQTAADAGALAAAHNLLPPVDEATARDTAVSWVSRNGFAIRDEDIRFWEHPSGRPAVTVRLTHPRGTIFGTRRVEAEASATLGGVVAMPKGVLPLALPAYQEGGRWWARGSGSLGDFRLLLADPLRGGPTELWLSAGGAESPGSVLPIALDGPGEPALRQGIAAGVSAPLAVGQTAPVLAGDLEQAVAEAFMARLDQGPDHRQVVLPLVAKSAAEGRPAEVTITGWAIARLSGFISEGRVQAHYLEKVLPETGVLTGGTGVGAYAPLLVETPQR